MFNNLKQFASDLSYTFSKLDHIHHISRDLENGQRPRQADLDALGINLPVDH